ncbi:MAG TPA: SgcJ/EcaC family oxidoreductase [Candidatus Binatia bacterium]|nr:SgcJ/EcaC family oxidoreductase [Candidatus Binatia bacterium]
MQLMDGWNKGSGEAFAAPFAEDGHLVGFDGTHFKGRDEIAAFHQPLFDKWLKGTRLVGEVESVLAESQRRPDACSRRNCDARKVATFAGAGLDSDDGRDQARQFSPKSSRASRPSSRWR